MRSRLIHSKLVFKIKTNIEMIVSWKIKYNHTLYNKHARAEKLQKCLKCFRHVFPISIDLQREAVIKQTFIISFWKFDLHYMIN